MKEREIPKVGQFYQHFKNPMYQIIAIAEHTETKEKMVVYQALYGTFSIYVCPLSMFLSEVDREQYPLEKYPYYTQKYCFEQIFLENFKEKETTLAEPQKNISNAENMESKKEVRTGELKHNKLQDNTKTERSKDSNKIKNKADAYMMEFLDANTYIERLRILDAIKPYCTERILQNMAVALDITISGGDLEIQFSEFRKALLVRMKYETGRLRS